MAKILVIEDDFSARSAIERGLRRDKHELLLATNGEEGLELAKGGKPNLIICDWMMPGMDGLEVCRKIKEDPDLKTIPVILVSGRISRDDMIMAFESGADDFLTKPFNFYELKARLRSGLRIHMLMNELKSANEKLRDLNSHLSSKNDKLHSLSHQDVLTDLPNRRALEISLPRLLTQVGSRTNESANYRYLAAFMLDVDHFKTFNDTHGHAVGDAVLKVFARRLISTLKPGSSLYRYAGDEFVCIAPGMNKEVSAQYAEALRKSISSTPFSLQSGLTVDVTTTIGGAIASEDNVVDMTELLDQADKALYKAKKSGRNCTQVD